MTKIELTSDTSFVVETNDTPETGLEALDKLYSLLMTNLPAAKGGFINSTTFKIEL